jgi:hypothetical protein
MRKIFRLRLLFPRLVFLWVPYLCYGNIAYVSGSATTCSQTSGSTVSQTCSLAAPTTAGDAVIVGVAWKTTSQTIAGVTAAGCTFFPYQQTEANSTSEAVAIWVGLNCPAISAITVTLSGGSVFETAVNEYSGVASIGQLTKDTGTSATPSASIGTQDSDNWIVMESGSLGIDGLPTAGTGQLRNAGFTGSTASDVAAVARDNIAFIPDNVTCSDAVSSRPLVTEMCTTNPADPLQVDASIIFGISYLCSALCTVTTPANESGTWTTAVSVNSGTANTQNRLRANLAATRGHAQFMSTSNSPLSFTMNVSVDNNAVRSSITPARRLRLTIGRSIT